MDSNDWLIGTPETGQAGQATESWEEWMQWDAILDDPSTTQDDSAQFNDQKAADEADNFINYDFSNPPAAFEFPRLQDSNPSVNPTFYDHSTFDAYSNGKTLPFRVGAPELSPPSTVNSRPSLSSDEGTSYRLVPATVGTAESDFVNSEGRSKHDYSLDIALQGGYDGHDRPLAGTAGTLTPGASSESAKESNTKKRKSSQRDPDERTPQAAGGRPVKKTAHNMIEKRYRINLNEKIANLRDSVPSLRSISRKIAGGGIPVREDPCNEAEELDGLTPAHKLNKGTVISKATEYIQHLEGRNQTLENDIKTLQDRLGELEELLTGTRAATPTARSPNATSTSPSMIVSQRSIPRGLSIASPENGSRELSQGPESMRRSHMARNQIDNTQWQSSQWQSSRQSQAAPTRPASSAPPQQSRASRRPGSLMNKLMVGSLAGLMVIEGFGQKEQRQDRGADKGLFAAPMKLLRRGGSYSGDGSGALLLGRGLSTHELLQIFKTIVLLASLIYLLFPLVVFKRRRKRSVTPSPVRLSSPPSLACPLEVRRQAWLTAIQTVWVPRHSFPLEAAALGMKTLWLSLYKLIGWEACMLLRGVSREEEDARVKAWEIALDAQLTGGDVEISKSRLVLTLMAAGTLPDTPLMLMHKALHIRILLWEVTSAHYPGGMILEAITARLARSCWNSARKKLQQQSAHAEHPAATSDTLPEHLSVLLDQDCDYVLVADIVHRAYHLAWNKPLADDTALLDGPMDSIVDDSAIRSPLDAVAAWWSCRTLQRALTRHLESRDDGGAVNVDIALALAAAPPHSGVQLHALVARAILTDDARRQCITAACELLPTPPPASTPQQLPHSPPSPSSPALRIPAPKPHLINTIGQTAIAPDVRVALALAMCLALRSPASQLRSKSPASEEKDTAMPGVPPAAAAASSKIATLLHKIAAPAFSSSAGLAPLSLLSFVAARQVLRALAVRRERERERDADQKDGIEQREDGIRIADVRRPLEYLAAGMRVWIGGEGGLRTGVRRGTRERLVEECLGWSRVLVGLRGGGLEGEGEAEGEGELGAGK